MASFFHGLHVNIGLKDLFLAECGVYVRLKDFDNGYGVVLISGSRVYIREAYF